MNIMKPVPPTEIQDLLKIIGFYSDGFCAGHCEHAPLRESNPELNAQIEAWHDKYYTSPDINTPSVDISDYLTGEPAFDWRAVAIDLATAIQTFDPEAWLKDSNLDIGKFIVKQAEWLEKSIIPALNRMNDVSESYSQTQADPF